MINLDVYCMAIEYFSILDKLPPYIKPLGLGNNILKSVSLAKGEFAWILGNDDLVLPNSFNIFKKLIEDNSDVDFYYVNSFHLEKKIIEKFDFLIDSRKIDFSKLTKFSNYKKSEKLNFFELVDPLKSYEFMLSMFLCIFTCLRLDLYISFRPSFIVFVVPD